MVPPPLHDGALCRYGYPKNLSDTGTRLHSQGTPSEHNSSSSAFIQEPLAQLRQNEASNHNQLYFYR